MALKGLQSDGVSTTAGSLFNSEPLRGLLNNLISFERIDRNINSGALEAVSLDTSCYNNSRSVTFFQANAPIPLRVVLGHDSMHVYDTEFRGSNCLQHMGQKGP